MKGPTGLGFRPAAWLANPLANLSAKSRRWASNRACVAMRMSRRFTASPGCSALCPTPAREPYGCGLHALGERGVSPPGGAVAKPGCFALHGSAPLALETPLDRVSVVVVRAFHRDGTSPV
jgi:hypothetical protein